jgi:hypothetical protein
MTTTNNTTTQKNALVHGKILREEFGREKWNAYNHCLQFFERISLFTKMRLTSALL